MVFNDIDKMEPNTEEIIEQPKHYYFWKEKIGIEPKDICKHFDFFTGNILKYIFRAGLKVYQGENARFSKIIDLKKARKYLDFLINDLEKASIK